MALQSQSIKNLKGGISQQPHQLRYPDQGTAQINGWSSETEGLQKRPPLVFKNRLGSEGYIGDKPLIHLINRDKTERYYACFTGIASNPIRVFDLTGQEHSVGYSDNEAKYYATSQNPRDKIRCITVADYTFVVNKDIIVEEGTDKTDGGTFQGTDVYHDCLIKVVGGQYGRTIKITINGKTAAYKCPPGVVSGSNADEIAGKMPHWTDGQFIIDNETAGTDSVSGDTYPKEGLAKQLRTLLRDDWTVTTGSGWIHVQSPASIPITELRIDDGYANQIASGLIHQVTSVTKLPLEAPDHYKVEITGDTTRSGDRYYVEYDAKNKVWKESVGWDIVKGLNASTMPHALIRTPSGNFLFSALDGKTDLGNGTNVQSWAERKVGDNDTNPQPSFVGGTFNDVFMFRNRLGLLSGENIILSQTAHYFNFYPMSVANENDDDPIDVAVSHNRISILKYAVPFSEQLLLWSDQAQFVLQAEGTLSAKTIELNLTTQFDVSDFARPFGLGQYVYFASPRANFTSIMRYYSVQDVSSVKDAENISAHVPSYIPNGVFTIDGTSSENFLTVLTENDPSKVFIYKFLYQNEQIAQQSWSHWDFGDNIRIFAANAINSNLFVIYETHDDLVFGTIDFTQNVVDVDVEPYRTYIDHKVKYVIPDNAYNIETNKTILIPQNIYGVTFSNQLVFTVIRDDGFIVYSDCDGIKWDIADSVYLDGDWSGQAVTVGFKFRFTYTFSQFLIKKQAEDGSMTSEDVGRLQLRRAWVNYKDSSAFIVRIYVGNRLPPYEYVMSGTIVNSQKAELGRLIMPTGQFRFPCQGNATQTEVSVVSDTPGPLSIIGCGWQGVHVARSSGI